MLEIVEKLKKEFDAKLAESKSNDEIEAIRIAYLGKKA